MNVVFFAFLGMLACSGWPTTVAVIRPRGGGHMGDEPKKNLALEALQKIKEAEIEARKIVQDAREKTSVKIIQDAYEDADQIKERVLNEARKQAQEKKRSIIQEAETEAKRTLEESQAEIDRLRERSTAARDETIARVAANIRNTIEGGLL
jgi:vacuolar-type H+-ATPase subunit H